MAGLRTVVRSHFLVSRMGFYRYPKPPYRLLLVVFDDLDIALERNQGRGGKIILFVFVVRPHCYDISRHLSPLSRCVPV